MKTVELISDICISVGGLIGLLSLLYLYRKNKNEKPDR